MLLKFSHHFQIPALLQFCASFREHCWCQNNKQGIVVSFTGSEPMQLNNKVYGNNPYTEQDMKRKKSIQDVLS